MVVTSFLGGTPTEAGLSHSFVWGGILGGIGAGLGYGMGQSLATKALPAEAADATKAANAITQPTETAVKMERHHLLPRQFKAFFERAGLEIDDYTINLERNVHKIIHGKGGRLADSWNAIWARFIRVNPEASAEEILIQLDYMMTRFQLR